MIQTYLSFSSHTLHNQPVPALFPQFCLLKKKRRRSKRRLRFRFFLHRLYPKTSILRKGNTFRLSTSWEKGYKQRHFGFWPKREKITQRASSKSIVSFASSFTSSRDLNQAQATPMGSFFIRSRFRRFLVARMKRYKTDIIVLKRFWVALGRKSFFYQKGQNQRMGKGVGSFSMSRRFFKAAVPICRLASMKISGGLRFFSYIRARIPTYVRISWASTRKNEFGRYCQFGSYPESDRLLANSRFTRRGYRLKKRRFVFFYATKGAQYHEWGAPVPESWAERAWNYFGGDLGMWVARGSRRLRYDVKLRRKVGLQTGRSFFVGGRLRVLAKLGGMFRTRRRRCRYGNTYLHVNQYLLTLGTELSPVFVD